MQCCLKSANNLIGTHPYLPKSSNPCIHISAVVMKKRCKQNYTSLSPGKSQLTWWIDFQYTIKYSMCKVVIALNF